MTTPKCIAIVKNLAIVAVLLAGATSLAMAQNAPATPAPSHAMKPMAATSKDNSKTATAMHGSDTVILSAAQRKTLWNDLSKQATNQTAAGFDATTGTFVPKTVKIKPIPGKLTADIPSLRPYDFAMVDHKLVIVDPTNKVIADVVTKRYAS